MGIDFSETKGKMIVDIGRKTSIIVVITNEGIVYGKVVKTGNKDFNNDIKKYLRKQHNVTISEDDVERIKIELGLSKDAKPISVYGKDLLIKLQIRICVSNEEVANVIDKTVGRIETAIKEGLEKIDSELQADIAKSGIYITGEGRKLRGLDERIQLRTGIMVNG